MIQQRSEFGTSVHFQTALWLKRSILFCKRSILASFKSGFLTFASKHDDRENACQLEPSQHNPHIYRFSISFVKSQIPTIPQFKIPMLIWYYNWSSKSICGIQIKTCGIHDHIFQAATKLLFVCSFRTIFNPSVYLLGHRE